jgi:hypothetical protein
MGRKPRRFPSNAPLWRIGGAGDHGASSGTSPPDVASWADDIPGQ